MKYSEAKSRIKDILESKYGDDWSDRYRVEDWKLYFNLSKRDDESGIFKNVLWVSKAGPMVFEAHKLDISEKPLADIFMELHLTPFEEREEDKKYVVKIWDTGAISSILVKDRISGLFSIMTTDSFDLHSLRYQVAFTKKEIDRLKPTATLNIDWDKAMEEYNGEI